MEKTIITGLFGLAVAAIEWRAAVDRKQAKKDREIAAQHAAEEKRHREEREKNHEVLMRHIISNQNAVGSLVEATARAVQRIPDAHCNGDMTNALTKVRKVKDEEREFLATLGIHSLWD